jgi:hypothetical protein
MISPQIMRHREFLCRDLAGAAVDFDLGHDRDYGTQAPGAGDAAAHQHVAGAVGAWRRVRLPPGTLARVLQIARTEGDRVRHICVLIHRIRFSSFR